MMKNSLKRFTAVLACTALTAALALPARAAEDQPIRVSEELERTAKNGYDRPAAQAEASTEDLNAVFDFLNSF